MDHPTSRVARVWPLVAAGVLWGVAVSAMESVVLPLQDGEGASFLQVMAWIVPGWSLVGIGIVALTERWGPRVAHPLTTASAMVGFALVFSALWSMVYAFEPVRRASAHIPMANASVADPWGAFAYQTWVVLFYGGFYVAAWKLNRKSERAREWLGRAEVARLDAENLLADAKLQLLRGSLEPGLLLRVITEVERRYMQDGPKADALLALLVAFLRRAMPAIRSGQSTLAGELAIVNAYDELTAAIESTSRRWGVQTIPFPDVPFPPLLLMPLLDELASAAASSVRGRIDVVSEAGEVTVRVFAEPVLRGDWLSPTLDYRMRVGLSTCFGEGWSMAHGRVGDPRQPVLAIALRQPSVESAASGNGGVRAVTA
jgi:hypothetical protein